MKYFKILPPPALKEYVQYYWVLKGSREEKTLQVQRVVPDGNVELFFHFKDCYERYDQDLKLTHENTRIGISGHLKKNTYIKPKGETGILGVRFNTVRAFELFKVPLSEITDDIAHPNDLLKRPDYRLEEKLINSADLSEQIGILNHFLQEQLAHKNDKDDLLAHLIGIVHQHSGRIRSQTLLNGIQLSNRQFNRNFGKKIGINLKLLSRIVKIRAIICELNRGNKTKLTELAYKFDYCDQAHFINDFKQLIGISPSEFLKEQNPVSEILFPDC